MAHLQADTWLSQHLQKDAFHLRWLEGLTTWPQVKAELEAYQSQPTPQFYAAKLSTLEIERAQLLQTLGFAIVDTSIVLERSAKSNQGICYSGDAEPVDSSRVSITIEDGQDTWSEAVVEIGRTCFQYSRFHLDPLIPVAVANQIKAAWLANCVNGQRGDRVLVAIKDQQPVGFLAALVDESGEAAVGVIDLMGVHSNYQHQGVGRSLVQAFIQVYSDRCSCLRVGTQVANIPALRLYQTCGFQVAKSQYILHCHS